MNDVKLTRSGVAYDLSISPHTVTLSYYGKDLTYVFSSRLYLDKFMEKLDSNRESINHSLSKRFGFTSVNNVLCDIKLYSMIEKRGFLIKNDKESFECLNTIKLDGTTLI